MKELTDDRVRDILRQAKDLEKAECSTDYEDVMAADVAALASEVLALRAKVRR